MIGTHFLTVVVLACFAAFSWSQRAAWTQSNLETLAIVAGDRAQVDQPFLVQLRELLAWCESRQLAREQELTLRLYIERDPGRQYIFFPSDDGERWQRAIYAECDHDWRQRIDELTADYARKLYQLALTWAATNRGTDSYQLLHEVLYWDPGHSEARRVLGHRRNGDGWQVVSERLRKQRGARPQSQMNWPAGSYWQIYTDQFDIASCADEQTTLRLSELLQQTQIVWRQVFFDYWGNAGMLQNWIAGTTRASPPSRRFKIILFANRQQYLDALTNLIPGVENSSGYYNDRLQTSFLYADPDPTIEETWRHELTHQLFQESIRARRGAFDANSLWLGEGIAMYLESIRDFDEFATLGGWDARKLQFARMRRLRLQQHRPLAELAVMSGEQFQRDPDVRQLYSQAAGLCHFLMVGEHGALRTQTVELLSAVYRGRIQPTAVEQILARSFDTLDHDYANFLRVGQHDLSQWLISPNLVTELSLADAMLDDEAWKVLGSCLKLKWLDLSGQTLTAQHIQHLSGLPQLEKLFLNRCQIDQGVLATLVQLPALSTLDLQGVVLDSKLQGELQALSAARPALRIQFE
ncbi:MAG TPA: hypothetical protein PKD54_01210 [Pirellulaceae bacterium]|nr:hypothetical protein [Pirellulaceae bacterium]